MSTDTASYTDPTAGTTTTPETIGTTETSTGLDQNVAGALSYLFGPVTGLLFYVLEGENRFVRFHAAQSVVIAAIFVVLGVLTSVLSTLLFAVDAFVTGGVIALLVGLGVSLAWLVLSVAAFVGWIYLMVRAYQGKTVRVPLAAKYADRMI